MWIRTTVGWSPVRSGYIKRSTGWSRFWFKANLPNEITKPRFNTTNNSGSGTIYDGPTAGTPQFINENLYGKDGTYSNYTSVTGRKISRGDTLAADVNSRTDIVTGDLFTSGGGVTTADRTALDGKYLFYEMTVKNGTDPLNTINSISNGIKMIKSYPALTDMGWTDVEQVGTQLTLNYTIENYYYNKIDPGLSYVRWWRSSTTNAGGTLLKEETITATSTGATSTSRTGTSLYTPVAADIDYYIVAEITGRSSYTDHYGYTDNYSMGSFPTDGVIGAALNIIDVNFTDTNGRSGKNARGKLVTSTPTILNWKVTGINSGTTYRVRYRVKSNETGLYYNPFSATQAAASLAWEVYEDNYNGTGNISSVSISGSTATLYDQFTIDSTFNGSTYGGGISRWILEYELSVVHNGLRRYWVYPNSMSSSQAHDYWDIDPTTDPSISRTPATISPGGTVTFSGKFNPYPAGLNSYPHSYRIVYGTSPATDSGWITLSSGTANQTYSNTKIYSDAGTYYPYIETTPSYTTNSATVTVASLYTITFDSKGGTSVSALTQSTVGGSIAKPTDPTKTSNTFGGWATTDGGTTAVTWPRTPTANETLYAIWTTTPTAPTSLTATKTSNTKITLDWSGGNGTSYDFYWSSSSTSMPSSSSSADFSTTNTASFDWEGGTRGTLYYLFVRSVIGTTKSGWFPTAAPGIEGKELLYAPPTPVVSNSAKTSTSLSWTWTAPTVGTTQDSPASWDYALTTSTTVPTSGITNTTTRPVAATPLTITGLSVSTDYYMHVRAKNADANGSWTYQTATTNAAAFVTPAWNGTMPAWASTGANGSNFRRTASSLQYGWNNGTFSFSGDVAATKGWDFYWSTTAPASTTTIRTPTNSFAYSTTTSGTQIYTTSFIYRINPTYTASSVYGSIRPYQYGTDGNKYVRGTYPNGTWSGNI